MSSGFSGGLKKENINVVLAFESKDAEEAVEELESKVKDA